MDKGKGLAPIGLTGDSIANLPAADDPRVLAAAAWLMEDDSAYAADRDAAIRAARSILAVAERAKI